MRPSTILRWLGLATLLGLLAGSGSALFLRGLAVATALQTENLWLLYLLPIAGIAIAYVYTRFGREAEAGNNVILDQIHQPNGHGVPLRMFPLVLFGTIATHLFGGSAGREGTAVQMGGSLAGTLARILRLKPDDTRLLLMAGISAGFGSVFGTPLAGAVFGMEVLAVGGIRYEALLPCLLASFVGDWAVHAWGVQHSHYAIASVPELTPWLLGSVLIASLAFGGASALFAELTHEISTVAKRLLPNPLIRTGTGGVLVIALTLLLGTRDYNGLSLPLLQQAFSPAGVPTFAFLCKLVLTSVTLGMGFKGGEVTPLFVVGATLGATLGRLLGVPMDLMAALGFIAVFAAAANTPLACVLMGIELFGAAPGVLLAFATFIAYAVSGHRGIYLSQRIETPKHEAQSLVFHDVSLREVRTQRSIARKLSLPLPLTSFVFDTTDDHSGGTNPMHRIHTNEYGLVRIYMSLGERHPSLKRRWYHLNKPLYLHLVDWARAHGFPYAVVKQTFHGYVNHGQAQSRDLTDTPNPHVNIYVEIAGERTALEDFIHIHATVLQGRFITYKAIEQWDLQPIQNPQRQAVADTTDEIISGN